jgi:hypothetical protein
LENYVEGGGTAVFSAHVSQAQLRFTLDGGGCVASYDCPDVGPFLNANRSSVRTGVGPEPTRRNEEIRSSSAVFPSRFGDGGVRYGAGCRNGELAHLRGHAIHRPTRLVAAPAPVVSVTSGNSGPLRLSVGFQTRPSGWDCGTPIQWGYALDHFRLFAVGGLARGSAPACIASSVPRPEATPSFLWQSSRKVRCTLVKSQFVESRYGVGR